MRGATSTPSLLGPWQVPSFFVMGPIFIMILFLMGLPALFIEKKCCLHMALEGVMGG